MPSPKLFLAASVACLAVAGVRLAVPGDPPRAYSPALSVSPERLNWPDARVGKTVVPIEFTNADPSRTVVLMNSASVCDENCCYRGLTPQGGVTLPPGASGRYEVELTVHEPGRFSATLDFFVDEGRLTHYSVPIEGIAHAEPPAD